MSWDFAQMWSNFLNWLADVTPKLLLAIVIFVVGWWTVKLIIMFVKKGLAKMGVEKSVITFLSSFCKYILRIFAFIIALTPFGFHISSLFAALGAFPFQTKQYLPSYLRVLHNLNIVLF